MSKAANTRPMPNLYAVVGHFEDDAPFLWTVTADDEEAATAQFFRANIDLSDGDTEELYVDQVINISNAAMAYADSRAGL